MASMVPSPAAELLGNDILLSAQSSSQKKLVCRYACSLDAELTVRAHRVFYANLMRVAT
jgi:hypothetical protein